MWGVKGRESEGLEGASSLGSAIFFIAGFIGLVGFPKLSSVMENVRKCPNTTSE